MELEFLQKKKKKIEKVTFRVESRNQIPFQEHWIDDISLRGYFPTLNNLASS